VGVQHMTENLFRCKDCGWAGRETDMAHIDDPEMEGNQWKICPQCRSAEQFEELCDECGNLATCGSPTPAGYRRTCFEHIPR